MHLDRASRREFVALLGSAATWPLAVRAEQRAKPIVGILDLGPPRPDAGYVRIFHQSLASAGFVDGQTVTIEYRWANNQGRLLAPLAEDLVQREVTVIVALGGPAVLAAKAATSRIPIVFALGADPIKFGLVASLNRPGGNITGVTSFSSELTCKRLDLVREIAPTMTTVAYISDPGARDFAEPMREMLATARALGLQAIMLDVRNEHDIDVAFATLVERRADALVVGPHIVFERNGQKIVELARRHRVPTIYPGRWFAVLGGLMSYTADSAATVRQIGSHYVAQILRGAKPADLPVQHPTKFDLIINLKTANELGLKVPPTLLIRADEVIE